jgi:hypothetical protein
LGAGEHIGQIALGLKEKNPTLDLSRRVSQRGGRQIPSFDTFPGVEGRNHVPELHSLEKEADIVNWNSRFETTVHIVYASHHSRQNPICLPGFNF